MADIVMCKNGKCSLRGNSLRFMAIPSRYQSYYVNDPEPNENNVCCYYLEVERDSITRKA